MTEQLRGSTELLPGPLDIRVWLNIPFFPKVAASENFEDVSQPLVHFSTKSEGEHSFGTRTSVRAPLVCVFQKQLPLTSHSRK